jgi:hypothetical protein
MHRSSADQGQYPGHAALPPAGISPAAPNAARIYDWLLGGKENYDADRQAARRLLRAVPGASPAGAVLAEDIRAACHDGAWLFWWSWGEPVPAAAPPEAAALVSRVLRPARPAESP